MSTLNESQQVTLAEFFQQLMDPSSYDITVVRGNDSKGASEGETHSYVTISFVKKELSEDEFLKLFKKLYVLERIRISNRKKTQSNEAIN
jgi:hypothetical protein